jgi:hypothetical protein
MRLHVKKVQRGHKLRVRRYDGQERKIYGIIIFNLLIGISFACALLEELFSEWPEI